MKNFQRTWLLRAFYGVSFFAYPTFVLINLEHYKPKRLDEVHMVSVAQEVLNPRGPNAIRK